MRAWTPPAPLFGTGAANAQTFDTIKVAYLGHNQAPTLEQNSLER